MIAAVLGNWIWTSSAALPVTLVPEVGPDNRAFLLVCNICKANNVLALLRCAAAYDFVPLVVDKSCQPPPGHSHLIEEVKLEHAGESVVSIRCLRFPSLAQCEVWVRGRSLVVVGIEILEQALPLAGFPFPRTSGLVIVPGNEGAGLVPRLRRLCDGFVYIPQFGRGTASLNVHTATALVMHEFALQRKRSMAPSADEPS